MLNHIFAPELKMEIEQAAGNKTTEHPSDASGHLVRGS